MLHPALSCLFRRAPAIAESPRQHQPLPQYQQHHSDSVRILGAAGPNTARLVGGKPDKRLPDGWDAIDPKTGEMVGIDKGWGYMPGGSVYEAVGAASGRLDGRPAPLAIAMIQDWLKAEAFARWMEKPIGAFPLVVLPAEDAALIGAGDGVVVARLSADTAKKQKREHGELDADEYAQAQHVIDSHSAMAVQDNIGPGGDKTGSKSLVYILGEPSDKAGGYVLVVKATVSGNALWVTSYRRLTRNEAQRDEEVMRIINGVKRK